MRFSFQYNETALLAFHEYHRMHSPAYLRGRMLTRLGMIPFMLIYVLFVWFTGSDIFEPAIMAVAVSALWFFLYPSFYDRQSMHVIKQLIQEGSNKRVFGEYTIELTPEYLHSVFPGGEQKFTWSRVQKVENTDDHLFIYTTSTSAIVIPCVSLVGALFDEVTSTAKEYFSKSTT